MDEELHPRPRKGRGAISNPDGRFEVRRRVAVDDGWARAGDEEEEDAPGPGTTLAPDASRSIIARNDSPDIPFDRSINPYRGCEHGCVYCYARPTHGWLGLSAGLDFETRIFFKPDAARLLRAELARPGYRPAPIAFGTNTDPYQPAERGLRITRALLELLAAQDHPVTIVTKSALVLRDADILGPMSRKRLARVFVSLTTLDRGLARRLEPRAASPARRLEAIAGLAAGGVDVGAMPAPLIPALPDHELEPLLEAAARAGARAAGYTMLRLPHEVKDLFREWLEAHEPLKAARVLARVARMRGGALNDPRFGARIVGEGEEAALVARRFRLASKRLGLGHERQPLDASLFRPPSGDERQASLF
ncbi:MAG: PA0069 family radical SAM protein [Alphaproteobacteria bacterium]